MSEQAVGGPRLRSRSIFDSFPRGQSLPEEEWRARHRGIVALLWAHSIAVPVFALVRSFPPIHAFLESLILPAAALAAAAPALSRRARTVAASAGLLTASAVLVHMSGGVIEMHFHFFVMVTVVALYQDWLPFLAAIAYVFIHHGALGAVDPESVFNHRAALERPWVWAGIHALFIAGISATCLVTWRLNETTLGLRRRAENRLREEAGVVEALHEVGSALAAELELDRVVQMVTDAATERTGAAFGAFFYKVDDARGDSFLLYSLSGAPIEAFSKLGLPRSTDIFRPTFEGAGVVRLDDVTNDSRYANNAPHHGMPEGHLPVKSYLAVPVRSRDGGVLGGLFFGHPEPAQFTQTDERVVMGIASQASIAFDNARLYESERAARVVSEAAQARLGLLVEASRVLTTSLELEAILRGLATLVASSIADYCVIDLRDAAGQMSRFAAAGAPERHELAAAIEATPADLARVGHPIVRAFDTRRSELMDPAPDDLFGGGADLSEVDAPRSAIVVPLVGRHEVLAVLTLARAGTSHPLTADDLLVAEELARRAGFAVENARLYDRQRSVSETLQHSLLPEHLPLIPGIEAAARYRAGGPGVDVGGDWYDVLSLANGRVMVAMGDVVGRGERAAALMGQLRTAARVYAVEGRPPADIIGRLNDLLHELGPGDMATMICAELDPEMQALDLASAGHPPAIVVSPNGIAELVEFANGPPLGAVSRVTYESSVIAFDPGSTLVLYTDGLVEDRTTPIDTGLERLRHAVAGTYPGIEELCDRALATLEDGSQDDVALLAVRMSVLGDHLDLRLPTRPATLQPLRTTVRRWLVAAGATEEETYEVLVAAVEACANAIRHTRWSGSGFYELEAWLGDEIVISVRDEGEWRPSRAGDDGGGRGLHLMEAFMDHVDVATSKAGTTVTMTRRLRRLVAQAIDA